MKHPYSKIIEIDGKKLITFDLSTYIGDDSDLDSAYTSHCIHVKSIIDRHLSNVNIKDGHSWWEPSITQSLDRTE